MHWLRRTTALVWSGTMLLLAALGVATLLHLDHLRVQALDRAAVAVTDAGRAAEGPLNRALLRIDTLIMSLPRMLAVLAPDTTLDGAGFLAVLRELNQHNFLTRDIQIYTLDGSFITSALPVTRRYPPRLDREIAQLLAEDQGHDIKLARPARNRLTGEWAIMVGRRLDFPGHGSVLAVADLPLESIAGLISSPTAGLPVLVTLRRADGVVLASVPHRENIIGAKLEAITPASATGEPIAGIGDVSGAAAVVAARPVSHRSLILRASIDKSEALERWSDDRNAAVKLAAVFAMVMIGGALALSATLRQRERASAEIQEARRSLQEAIDSMADGFVLFDNNDRFVTCNQRFLEHFPYFAPAVEPGRPFAEIAAKAAEVVLPDATPAQRRSWIDWRIGRSRPANDKLEEHVAGRVIHSVEWRTASGGRVCTSRDVTERKRA
jgi:PAS domain-containing protein